MNNDTINITFPDGGIRQFPAGSTSLDIVRTLGRRLADEALAAQIGGKTVDLNSPIVEDSELRILTFEDDAGKEVYWHSTSHLMAHAVESLWPGARFGVGPAIEQGFYYDIDIDRTLTPEDLLAIENRMAELAREDKPFERKELAKAEARSFFEAKGDPYKIEIIDELDEGWR
jgi:threonyl-tRNA synthetase